jgi:hypothetical protein
VPEPGRASASGRSGLSRTGADLSLGTDPEAPSVHFLVTAGPVVDINVGFTGQLTCTLNNELLTAHIPIPGAPGLEVGLTPVVEFTAGGQARLDAETRGNGTRKHPGAGDVM